MRVKVLAKEIERGIKSINALQTRAYNFYIAEKPFSPGWVEEPGLDTPDVDKPTWDAEGTTIPQFVAAAGGHSGWQEAQTYDTKEELEAEDIIDLKLRRQVHQPWRLPSRYKCLKFYLMICFYQRERLNTQLLRTHHRPRLSGFHTAQRTRSHRLREARQSRDSEGQSEDTPDDYFSVHSANRLP
jgi:hypothetical protein